MSDLTRYVESEVCACLLGKKKTKPIQFSFLSIGMKKVVWYCEFFLLLLFYLGKNHGSWQIFLGVNNVAIINYKTL